VSNNYMLQLDWWHGIVVTCFIRSTKLLYTGLGYYLDRLLPADMQPDA